MYRPILRLCQGTEPCDLSLPRVDEFGMFDREPSPKELARLARCDFFLVSPPPYAHQAYAMLALEKHVPFICEKPVGVKADVALALQAEARRSDAKALANYQLRFDPCVLFMRDHLVPHELVEVQITYQSSARVDLSGKPVWYRLPILGGGIKFSLLSHLSDLIIFLGLEVNNHRLLTALPRSGQFVGNDMIAVRARANDNAELGITCSGLASSDRFMVTLRHRHLDWIADLITGTVTEVARVDCRRQSIIFEDNSSLRGELGVWRYCFLRCLQHVVAVGVKEAGVAEMNDALKVHRFLQSVQDLLNERARVGTRPQSELPEA